MCLDEEIKRMLAEVEKENPSTLRMLCEEIMQRLYEYERDQYPLVWLRGIETDLVCALNHWGGGCMNSSAKRKELQGSIRHALSAMKAGEIELCDSVTRSRIYELSVTIDVINDTFSYIYEVRGNQILTGIIQQVFDLKKLVELKRQLLQGSLLPSRTAALSTEEAAADTPAKIIHVLNKRCQKINLHLLTKQGRKQLVTSYFELSDRSGCTRHLVLHSALAETAETLDKLHEMCSNLEVESLATLTSYAQRMRGWV